MEFESLWRWVQGRGVRMTPQRRHIIKALAEADRPQTALEIHRRLVDDCPELGLDTVYRNLRLLAGLGVVNKIAAAGPPGGAGQGTGPRSDLFEMAENHHHHRVCLRCGDIVCLPVCPLGGAAGEACAGPGFRITGHVFEIYGYCERCGGMTCDHGVPGEQHG